jgi:hypothetical protein
MLDCEQVFVLEQFKNGVGTANQLWVCALWLEQIIQNLNRKQRSAEDTYEQPTSTQLIASVAQRSASAQHRTAPYGLHKTWP